MILKKDNLKVSNRVKKKIYYFDYAAATPLDPRVKKAMAPYESEFFGNPSSIHQFGEIAKDAIEESRQKIAKILNCRNKEIIFTGSGTEANNLTILGIARLATSNQQPVTGKNKKMITHYSLPVTRYHIITSKIEHESVFEPCRQLEKEGFKITYLPVDQYGFVNPKDIKNALRPETILVSIMYANNEIGTIEPISEIAKIIRNFIKTLDPIPYTLYPLLHTDACQAAEFLDLNIQKLGVDLMTLNAAKIYGPKGVGILYKKDGINLEPLIYGGGQEKNLRSGTENVSAIIGTAKALEIAQKQKDRKTERQKNLKTEKMTGLRDYLIKEILRQIPNSILNGPQGEKRLPNNVNISFLENDAEAILAYLEKYNIYASAGSACSSLLPASYVVSEITRSASSNQANKERAKSAIRFSLGKEIKKEDVDFLIKKLSEIINQLK